MSLVLDGTNGETFPTWATSGRPASPAQGQVGFNTTLNSLEAYNGSTWQQFTNGPAFSAYGTALQSIATGTYTKIAFNTKLFDTNSNYDNTTNYRFTPTVAGYYQVNAQCLVGGGPATTQSAVAIYKNGANAAFSISILNGTNQTIDNVSALIYCNGSTDYIEAYMYQGSGSSVNCGSSTTNVTFSASMVRSA